MRWWRVFHCKSNMASLKCWGYLECKMLAYCIWNFYCAKNLLLNCLGFIFVQKKSYLECVGRSKARLANLLQNRGLFSLQWPYLCGHCINIVAHNWRFLTNIFCLKYCMNLYKLYIYIYMSVHSFLNVFTNPSARTEWTVLIFVSLRCV